MMEATPGFEPGMEILQTSALPLGYVAPGGAGNGTRTRDINLGKVALYQLSYSRITIYTEDSKFLYSEFCQSKSLAQL